MTGMMARSVSFSAVNWEPNFVKTVTVSFADHKTHLLFGGELQQRFPYSDKE
jgi:hypothetical protein